MDPLTENCDIPAANSTGKVCRICLNIISSDCSYTSLQTSAAQAFTVLKFLIPHFDTEIVSEAVLCSSCNTELNNIRTFREKCMESEKKICSYVQRLTVRRKLSHTDLLNVATINLSFEDVYVKQEKDDEQLLQENLNIEMDPLCDHMYVKQEELEVKSDNEELTDSGDDDMESRRRDEGASSARFNICEKVDRKRDTNEDFTDSRITANDITKKSTSQPFQCDTCKRTFQLKTALKAHIDHKRYKCIECNRCFRGKNAHTMHMRRIHTKEKPFKCGNCGKKFPSKYDMDLHVKRIHLGVKAFGCARCGKRFVRNRDYKRHLLMHSGEKPFKCTMCPKEYVEEYTLKVHMKEHTQPVVKPHRCEVCGKGFKKKSQLVRHKVTHVDEKPFICDICDEKFKRKCTLDNHLRIHKYRKEYDCDGCEKKFTKIAHLLRHKTTHVSEKRFNCDVCSEIFLSEALKNQHLLLAHSDIIKTKICGECGKEFRTTGLLRQHKQTHTEEKPFKCDVCGNAFRRKYTLTSHLATHSGEKPYDCDLCEKKFGTKRDLARHRARHTGKKSETLN